MWRVPISINDREGNPMGFYLRDKEDFGKNIHLGEKSKEFWKYEERNT